MHKSAPLIAESPVYIDFIKSCIYFYDLICVYKSEFVMVLVECASLLRLHLF